MADDSPIINPIKAPVVAHLICNAVLICSCPDHLVLVLNVFGGKVQCPRCLQEWYSPKMDYMVDQVTKTAHVNCTTDAVPKVDLYDGMGMANLKFPRQKS